VHIDAVAASAAKLMYEALHALSPGGYDAVLCRPNAYCISADKMDDSMADSIASFRHRKTIYRLWKREGDKYLIPRGFGLRLERIGFKIQPFAPWLDPTLFPMYAQYLRDYQQEVLQSALMQMRKIGSATIEVATGGGKTWIGCAAAAHFSMLGAPVIYAALPTDLLVQLVRVCRKMGISIGMWTGSEKRRGAVLATTAASLYKAIKQKKGYLYDLFSNVGLFIFDESQHLPAKMLISVTKNLPHAFILSMSATPYHTENLDEVIYAISGDIAPRRVLSSELIERGYLVPIYIFQIYTPVSLQHGKLANRKDYNNIKRKVWMNPVRAQFIGQIAKLLAKLNLNPIMVYAKEIEHIDLINKVTGNMFIKISSEINIDTRRLLLDALCTQQVDRRLYGFAITTVGREGLDVPCVRSVIHATAGRSRVEVIQVPGRLTRPWQDKKFGVVVDLVDRVPVYERQANERVKLWSREKHWRVFRVNGLAELEMVLADLVNR